MGAGRGQRSAARHRLKPQLQAPPHPSAAHPQAHELGGAPGLAPALGVGLCHLARRQLGAPGVDGLRDLLSEGGVEGDAGCRGAGGEGCGECKQCWAQRMRQRRAAARSAAAPPPATQIRWASSEALYFAHLELQVVQVFLAHAAPVHRELQQGRGQGRRAQGGGCRASQAIKHARGGWVPGSGAGAQPRRSPAPAATAPLLQP